MEAGRPVRSYVVILGRADNGLDQDGSDEGKDSGCFLKAEPTDLTAEWHGGWGSGESVMAVGILARRRSEGRVALYGDGEDGERNGFGGGWRVRTR